jgi:hypothetical protein
MSIRRFAVLTALTFSGCVSGKVELIPPKDNSQAVNSIVVDKPRAEVWAAAIPKLSKQFFVINNLDQSSGLINVSYSGDPEAFVDGGTITSLVDNARGPRTYTFPASKAYYQYEIVNKGDLLRVDRKMSLEGRVNVVLEDMPAGKTRVTANARYILTRSAVVTDINGRTNQASDTITFSSGQMGSFQDQSKAKNYWPTGRLESDILSAFQ